MPDPKQYASNVPPDHRPVTINVPKELHRRLKIGAAMMEKATMSDVINALLNIYTPAIADGIPEPDPKRSRELQRFIGQYREDYPPRER